MPELRFVEIDGLSDKEVNFLYFFVKNKYIHITSPIILEEIWSIYSGIYDISQIQQLLNKLVKEHYLNASSKIVTAAYGLEIDQYKKLQKIFRYQIQFDKTTKFLKEVWGFLWQHFIITILVALATAYFYTKFDLHT